MVLIVTTPCNCLSSTSTLHILFWSFKALSDIKEEHNVVWGILGALLAAQLLFVKDIKLRNRKN